MKKTEFPRIGSTLYTDILPNGLRIKVIPKPGFSKMYAFFATDYGSIDTKFVLDGKPYISPEGVAHYLEHKMFDMKDGNALQALSATGASPNAFTSYNMTAYYFQCTDGFEENLRILLSFVSEGYFTEESVEKERGIIAQEIKMYEDNPGSRLDENLFAAMYQNHPIRKNIAGTVESIQEITAQTLYDCHRAFYDPSNMVLCVCGDIDPERVKEIALEILPKEPGGASDRDYGEEEPMLPTQNYISQAMEVSMPMFCIGVKCPEIPKGADRFRLEALGDLAIEVLCGESSPLYLKLYEEGLIDSGFSVGYGSIKGLAAFNMSGDSDYPEQVRDAILEEAKRIAKEGVDENLFRRLKRSALGRRIRGLDSFDGMCYRMAIADFDGYDYFAFQEVYDSLTAEDARKMIEEYILPEQTVLSVIYPKDIKEEN